jgi:hypothetical protein
MITLDNLFDDENRDVLAKMEAESEALLKRMGEGNLGKSGLDAIRTNNKTGDFDSFSKSKWQQLRNGIPNYFGDDSIFNDDEGYVEFINFERLLNEINYHKSKGFFYNYTSYESQMSYPVRSLIMQPKEIEYGFEEIQQEVEELTGIQIPEIQDSPSEKRMSAPYTDPKTKTKFYFEGKLNIREGFLPLDKEHTAFHFEIDSEKNILKFTDYFLYREESGKKYKTNVAITISANNYATYIKLCKLEGLYLTQASKDKILTRYYAEFKAANNDPFKLGWLYDRIPGFVLNRLPDQKLWQDLQIITVAGVNNMSVNLYNVVLTILAAAKDYRWWVNTINTDPSIVRMLFDDFPDDYISRLISVFMKIGAGAWNEDDYNKAPFFGIEDVKIENKFGVEMA